MAPENNVDGYVDGDDLVFTRDCARHCGRRLEIRAKMDDFKDWKMGKLIQQAFPYLTAAQRETLITGICDKCWETMYGEEAINEFTRRR